MHEREPKKIKPFINDFYNILGVTDHISFNKYINKLYGILRDKSIKDFNSNIKEAIEALKKFFEFVEKNKRFNNKKRKRPRSSLIALAEKVNKYSKNEEADNEILKAALLKEEIKLKKEAIDETKKANKQTIRSKLENHYFALKDDIKEYLRILHFFRKNISRYDFPLCPSDIEVEEENQEQYFVFGTREKSAQLICIFNYVYYILEDDSKEKFINYQIVLSPFYIDTIFDLKEDCQLKAANIEKFTIVKAKEDLPFYYQLQKDSNNDVLKKSIDLDDKNKNEKALKLIKSQFKIKSNAISFKSFLEGLKPSYPHPYHTPVQFAIYTRIKLLEEHFIHIVAYKNSITERDKIALNKLIGNEEIKFSSIVDFLKDKSHTKYIEKFLKSQKAGVKYISENHKLNALLFHDLITTRNTLLKYFSDPLVEPNISKLLSEKYAFDNNAPAEMPNDIDARIMHYISTKPSQEKAVEGLYQPKWNYNAIFDLNRKWDRLKDIINKEIIFLKDFQIFKI